MSHQMNQGASISLPPRLLRTDATSEGLRKFVAAYREYTWALGLTVGCGKGGNRHVPIQVRGYRDEAYLDHIFVDRLEGRPLTDVTEAKPTVVLKSEAGISYDGPSVGEFCEAMEEEARMD